MNYFTNENTDGNNTDNELIYINRKLEIVMLGISKDSPDYNDIMKEKADAILKIWES